MEKGYRFLKERPLQPLNKEWDIEQTEKISTVSNRNSNYADRNSDKRSYTIKKREKILVYEHEGKEQGKYDLTR